MVYLFPIVLTLLLSYHYDYQGHKKWRMEWYTFLLIYCILVAGLRYRIGGDTVMYLNNYDRLPDLTTYLEHDFSNEKFGRAYVLLCAISKSISGNFIILQILLATILNSVIFYFFYQNTRHIFIAVLLYLVMLYLNLNTEVLRESMAVVCVLIGWKYFYRKCWLKFYLLAGIAVLFHPSSVFIFLLPLCTNRLLRKLFSISWLSLIFAFGLFFLGIILTSKFYDIIRLIGFATLDNYADLYEASDYSNARDFNIIGKCVNILNYIGYPFLIGWILTKLMKNKEKEVQDYYRSLILMMLVYSYIGVLTGSMVILYRLNNYMTLFMILGTSDAIYHSIPLLKYKLRTNFVFWQVLLLPLVFIPIWSMYRPSGITNTPTIHRYYPYYSILTYKTDPEREKIHYYYQNK